MVLPRKFVTCWLLDGCYYVAAATQRQAGEWHFREYRGWPESIVNTGLEYTFVDGEPGARDADGKPLPTIKVADRIAERLAAGERPPFCVCIDGSMF